MTSLSQRYMGHIPIKHIYTFTFEFQKISNIHPFVQATISKSMNVKTIRSRYIICVFNYKTLSLHSLALNCYFEYDKLSIDLQHSDIEDLRGVPFENTITILGDLK